jgi:hypothetical protein
MRTGVRRWRNLPERITAHLVGWMRTRLEEFALTLHPEKTRLIEFGRHAARNR